VNFNDFCNTNCMENSDIAEFEAFLKKRKDNLEARSIHNWLYLFNLYFDNK